MIEKKSTSTNTVSVSSESSNPSNLRSALADVLKKVDAKSVKELSDNDWDAKNNEINKNPNMPSRAMNDRQELERLAAEAEAEFSRLQEPSKPIINGDDPLAPKKIEKFFKSPTTEKSPFAS